jgi:hypothetical protein
MEKFELTVFPDQCKAIQAFHALEELTCRLSKIKIR